ncbi:MAG: class I tRNA ligase family protein, partial [Bacteroidota bacterium]
MVNWDPAGQTALADDEVIFKEVQGQLVHIRYRVENSDEFVTIATVRPETIMADSAICVHPEDSRYQHLIGRKALIPLIGKAIPVIADAYVDMEFGTGCLKVTPAHDPNDYALGLKHGLEVIDMLDDQGRLNPKAQIMVGVDRFEARRQIIPLLEAEGALVHCEPYTSSVGHSERTNAVVEPKLSLQWFVKMQELAEPALQAVIQGEVSLFPDKFMATYRHWMENCRDWCISRQLWWGQRIPAWYSPDGQTWVAEDVHQAAELTQGKWRAEDLSQDEDVLDTWFSSWLWPLSVFDPDFIRQHNQGQEPNRDLAYYYPTSVLVTGPDILFFWVARMIMAGQRFHRKVPFKDVYLTGIVRDKQGRKMAK